MRSFIVSINLVKAAELDVIRATALKLLRGLHYDVAYTPHFAMCADNLSEIIMTTNADVADTRSVMRFSCSGLFPKAEMKRIREHMDDFARLVPETVGLWCDKEPDYFEKAAIKANNALQKSLKEISRKPGNFFNVLIINNDTLPLLELIASKEFNDMEVSRPGDVIQFRYEVVVGSRGIMNWRLVHAYNFR